MMMWWVYFLVKRGAQNSSGSGETSGSAISVDRSAREEYRLIKKRKRMTNPSLNQGEVISSQGVPNVGVVKKDIFKGTGSRRMEKAKAKRKIPRMSRRVMDLML